MNYLQRAFLVFMIIGAVMLLGSHLTIVGVIFLVVGTVGFIMVPNKEDKAE